MVCAKAIRTIEDDVPTGTSLALSIRTTGLFPSMLLQMTRIGGEPGSLDDMLEKAGDHFEPAVYNAADSLISLMEPLIMSILGLLVRGAHDHDIPTHLYVWLCHLTVHRDPMCLP